MRRRTPEEVVQHILATSTRDQATGCLLSSLPKDKKGYARVSCGGRWTRAHRVVFFAGYPPAGGPHTLHTCDSPACVEKAHLYAGSNNKNIADKVSRDRSGKKLNIAKVREVQVMLTQRVSQSRIAERVGVNQSNVSRIKTRARWAHVQLGVC